MRVLARDNNWVYVTIILLSFVLTACGVDNTPPTAPTGLQATAISNSEIQLSWNESEDNYGVKGYRIYRSDFYIFESPISNTIDKGLAAQTTYCYAVSAYDEDNESDVSDTACAKTLTAVDLMPPVAPDSLTLEPQADKASIKLSWSASDDNVGVVGYYIYNSSDVNIGSTSALWFLHNGLTSKTNYCYYVRAYDAAFNKSQKTPTKCVDTL